ncbi:type II and III secretion system protein family protein [Phenylobacterium sp.]|uniref:type II and III secretion system protein family protein n=1 Tax=Phenylobacterium sp. TaxID=1871053 RepID=UPI002E307EFF|nr:type II and III secretion system protein family protein [Phenylobacterium sp.]HEX3366849.1 type II and III secretion system protein family protein [Phenylobacterium sp.]
MPRQLAVATAAALALLSVGAVAMPAHADAMMSEQAPSRVITVPKDKSLSFRLDEPASKIVVAQPDIAEVVATTDRSFYVRGLDVGSTNLLVYGPGGRLMQVIDVRVGVDAALLERDLAQALPNEHIKVQSLGEGVLLTGDVSSPGAALRAKAIADKLAPDAVTSMLRAAGSQVLLEVRVLEATRSTSRDIGLSATISNNSVNFSYGNGLISSSPPSGVLSFSGRSGNTTIDATLQALESKGMIRTLARPNLVALSGEKASFLAGGEFPFPVPAGNQQITIEFRQYGVKLDFTPTVQEDGKIRLLVAPEVSALDPTNTVRVDNVTVPALTMRRANTTVELRDGDSLAIGGLFQHTAQTDLNQIPGLGNIPILSALFRSTRYQRNETELLIIVTPHIVTQGDIDHDKNRNLPGAEPDMAGFLIDGKALDKPMAHDLRGPVEAPAPPAAQAAATPTAPAPAPIPAQALRGEIAPPPPAAAVPEAPTVPASGK